MSCALWSSAVPLLLAVGPGSARLMRRAVAPPRQPARWSLLPHSMRLAWQRAHLFPLTRSVQRLSGWRDQHRGHAVRLHPVCGLHQRNDGTAYSGGAAPRVLPVRPPPLPGLASTWPLRAWALSHPRLDDRAVPPGRRCAAPPHRCPGLAQPPSTRLLAHPRLAGRRRRACTAPCRLPSPRATWSCPTCWCRWGGVQGGTPPPPAQAPRGGDSVCGTAAFSLACMCRRPFNPGLLCCLPCLQCVVYSCIVYWMVGFAADACESGLPARPA